ncbi:unnamed protein product [Enterobius vermicularis]|uniref:Transcriptional regulator n=1 Tax=Enterobius vermicularis TaxID=51028 RepID=A0A0N4VEH3_ENTVE|nr:unnamed protein product [Enterobius vermicularis]
MGRWVKQNANKRSQNFPLFNQSFFQPLLETFSVLQRLAEVIRAGEVMGVSADEILAHLKIRNGVAKE